MCPDDHPHRVCPGDALKNTVCTGDALKRPNERSGVGWRIVPWRPLPQSPSHGLPRGFTSSQTVCTAAVHQVTALCTLVNRRCALPTACRAVASPLLSHDAVHLLSHDAVHSCPLALTTHDPALSANPSRVPLLADKEIGFVSPASSPVTVLHSVRNTGTGTECRLLSFPTHFRRFTECNTSH